MSKLFSSSSNLSGVFASGETASKYTLNFHRGGGYSRPENTLETFLWAWNLGVIPEGDVQYTSDGVPVMFHDDDLSRLPWGLNEEMKKQRIADLEWSVVRKLDVGSYKGARFSPQRIPTLESVFASMSSFPERKFYLDEKGLTPENQKQIAKLARSYKIVPQLLFTSGNYAKIRQWQEICPDGRAMHWLGYCWGKNGKCDLDGLNRALDELRNADFRGITHLNVHILADFSNSEPFSPESRFIEHLAAEMRERKLPFQVISLTQGDNPEVYRRLLDLGLRGLATDFPEVMLGVLKSRCE